MLAALLAPCFMLGLLLGLRLRPPQPESPALLQLRRRYAALSGRVAAAAGRPAVDEAELVAALGELDVVGRRAAAAEASLAEMTRRLDAVYDERNLAAAALVRAGRQLGWHGGTYVDPQAEEWPVLSLHLPSLGEVTWHIPSWHVSRSRASRAALGLPAIVRCWDGHDAAARDARLEAFVLGRAFVVPAEDCHRGAPGGESRRPPCG